MAATTNPFSAVHPGGARPATMGDFQAAGTPPQQQRTFHPAQTMGYVQQPPQHQQHQPPPSQTAAPQRWQSMNPFSTSAAVAEQQAQAQGHEQRPPPIQGWWQGTQAPQQPPQSAYDAPAAGDALADEVRVPLLGGPKDAGPPTSARSDGASMSPRAALAWLVLGPWITFTVVTTLLVTKVYHDSPALVWLLVVTVSAAAGGVLILGLKDKRSNFRLYLGALLCLAILFACPSGLYNYAKNAYHYYKPDDLRTYKNVLASEQAEAHADAGVVYFAPSAFIDNTRAVGYQAGTRYCVAPIRDDQSGNKVQYWAVGMDCCGARSDFRCPDAHNPAAKAGVVTLDPYPQVMSSARMYLKAIQQCEALFGLVSAPEPLLVTWTASPAAVEADYRNYTLYNWLAASGAYLLLALTFGMVLVSSVKKD